MTDRRTFTDIILRSDLFDYMSALSDDKIEEMFGRDYMLMRGFDQHNPHHCYNLFDHIIKVTELVDVTGLSREDAVVLKTAAFFHDVGKRKCAEEKDGRLVYPLHADVSYEDAQVILRDIGFDDAQVRRIAFFIRYHDVFLNLRLADGLDTRRTGDKIISVGSAGHIIQNIRNKAVMTARYYPSDRDFRLLMRICRADAAAQAEVTYRDGALHDTRENKLRRADELALCVEKITERTSDGDSKGICIFGASSDNVPRSFKKAARRAGELIATGGFRLIFGAGGRGLMAEAAKGAHGANGTVTGVIPEKLNIPNIVSPHCTEVIVTPTMHVRKATMERLSDAFIALGGGFGTLEELLEIITLKQLGYTDVPIVILNTDNYYDNLIAMFRHCTEEGFADPKYLELFHVCDTPEEAIEYVTGYKPTPMPEKVCS